MSAHVHIEAVPEPKAAKPAHVALSEQQRKSLIGLAMLEIRRARGRTPMTDDEILKLDRLRTECSRLRAVDALRIMAGVVSGRY